MLALGSIGSRIFGGLLGSRSRRKDRAMQQAQFNAQMDESVQRRVADAKKAGIHPLFALGASVGASPTLSGGSTPGQDAFQGISRDLSALAVEKVRSEIRKTNAEAAVANSEAATLKQRLASSGRDNIQQTTYPSGNTVTTYPYPTEDWSQGPVYGPGEFFNPEVPVSMPGHPAREAGVRPSYVEYRREDGSTGLAFGASVPGAEEINAIWIPLQNWWHTSKVARSRLKKALGISTSDYARMRRDPDYARRLLQKNKAKIQRLKLEFQAFRKAASGRPER